MNRDESVRFATKYLEDLLSFFGINVAVWSTIDDQVIQLSVPSTSLNSLLIGKNAGNLRALQHIVSMGLTMKNAEITRVNIDIADYKHPTGIHSPTVNAQEDHRIFTLDGRYLGTNTEKLHKGIYIINHKKIVVK